MKYPSLRHFALASITLVALAGCNPNPAHAAEPVIASDAFAALADMRHEGARVDKLALPTGGAWGAVPGVVLRADGAATCVPGATANAWVVLPPAVGTSPSATPIMVEADVDSSNSAWTAIGLGGEGFNYWATDQIFAILNGGGRVDVFMKTVLLGSLPAPNFVKGGFNHMKLTYAQATNSLNIEVNGVPIPLKTTLSSINYMADIKSASFYFFGTAKDKGTGAGPGVKNFTVTGATPVHMVAPTLTPVDISAFLIDPAKPTTLSWTVEAIPAVNQLHYAIKNYDGTTVDSGVEPVSASGQFSLPVKLAQGYYDIDIAEARQSFGALALPAHAGVADSFFGMDSGLTWLEQRAAIRTGLLADMKRLGIAISRERLSWNAYNPKPGVTVTTARHIVEMRDAYRQSGVKVLEILYGSPAWTAPYTSPKRDPFPSKLPEASQGAKTLATGFKASWGGVEIWNEPDYDGTANLPADQYVPLIKAAAYGFGQAESTAPIGGGVFAVCNRPYIEQCVRNGMLDNVDFVSFHNYGTATSVEGAVQDYRTLLREGGKESMPLWLTESGWPWKSGPDRPPLAEDRISATEIAAKALEAKIYGIAAFFPFVLPYYTEPGKNFSMVGKDATPLRSLAAYGQAIRVLSHANYLGDVAVSDPKVKRARAFKDAAGATFVSIYAGDVPTGTSVKLPFPAQRAEGADGRTIPVAADGSVTISDGLVYIWPGPGMAPSLIRHDTTAAALLAKTTLPLPRKPVPSPIVMVNTIDDTLAQASTAGYTVNASSAHAFPIKVSVSNLSPADESLTITLVASGKPLSPAQDVVVPAGGVVATSWTVDVASALASSVSTPLTFTAIDKAGRVSTLSLNMSMDRELADYLKLLPNSSRLEIGNLAKWHKNASGSSEFKALDGGGWAMTTTYASPGDHWTVPHVDVDPVATPSTVIGFLMRARASLKAKNLINLVETKPGGIYGSPMPVVPADNSWHTVFIPISAFVSSQSGPADPDWKLDLDQLASIQIGQAGGETPHTIEVSDLYLVRK